jgi:hypothetical protein
MTEHKPMEAAIERLKASKAAYTEEVSARGEAAGADWARDDAEYAELKALAQHWEGHPIDDTSDAPEAFLGLIGPPADVTHSEVDAFWERLGFEESDPEKYSAEFWNGFVTGALAVFEEVKDKL